jgi:PAS domain S-box-containing protein
MSGAKELAGKVRRRWRTRLQTPLYLLSLFIAVVIISGGYLYYRTQERAARKIVVDQLTSIATLKVEGISRWLKERLADAQVLVSSPFFSEEVGLYFQKPDDRRREKLLSRLSITAKAYYYSEIIILDAEKNIRLSLPPSIGSISPDCYNILDMAAKARQPFFSDLHRESPSGPIHLDIAAPLLARQESNSVVVGWALFRVEAASFLFPLLQEWPVPSKTAETLLVRREGQEVLFLNELRHRQNTALNLKFPLTEKEIPAVRAARGETGLVEGRDYRGEKVIAHIAPIPETPWIMVAKINTSEAFGPWRSRSLLIILVILGVLTAQLGLTENLWQRREKAHYRQLYQAEAQARESEALFRILNESSLAGVYLIQDGLLRYVNQAAADFFGYTPEELIDKQNPLVVVHPKDKALVQENIRKRLAGEIRSLRYEFLGQRKDGSTLNVEVHGSIINYRGRPAIIGNLIDITERKRLLEEVQKSASELRSTLYSIGDAVIVTDLNSRVMMMNPVAEKLTGWTEAEAKDRPVEEVFHLINEFSRQPAENPVERVIREGVVVGLANHSVLVSREGQEYPVADSGAPILRPDGQMLGVVLVFRDQTEERRAQQAIRKSEREKSAILTSMSELVAYQSLDHTILWANKAAADSLGLKPEDLVGRRCYELWHGRNEPCEICPVSRARDTGRPQEDEVKTPDGRYWQIRGYPVREESGQIVGMIEVTLEITEKRKAQMALKASEERYRRLTENAQDIIYRYTFYPRRGFEYVNPAATTITGYTPEEHYADPDLGFKMIVEEDKPLLEKVSTAEVSQPVVLRWRRKDGEIIWTEQRNVPIYDEAGRLVAIEGIARDITERMKNEAALRASLKEKEVLLREIHHRVKNNMQVISSLLNLQSRLIEDPQMVEMFRQCQRRIRSMALVHDKLYRSPDLANIDFAEYLKSLAETIFQDYRWQLGQVELKIDLDPLNLNINKAVPVGLIVNELITNSLKHGFPWGGKGTIWVTLKRVAENQARLQVKDDGVGIPEGFDLKKAQSMGLIIINTLVGQIDGEIEIRREAGTDVRITFPLP